MDREKSKELDRLSMRYLAALDAADFDTISELWHAAETDRDLSDMLVGINEELAREIPRPPGSGGYFMTSAEFVFKKGFAPSISTGALKFLLAGCRANDPRLAQGKTCRPVPSEVTGDWPADEACGMGYCGVYEAGGFCPAELHSSPLERRFYASVGEVEEYFARLCHAADTRMGEPAACRWFLNWFDDTDRREALHTLACWVGHVLDERGEDHDPPPAPPPAAAPVG